jgi:lipoyl(octanoyl) transferase
MLCEDRSLTLAAQNPLPTRDAKPLVIRRFGCVGYASAFALQQQLVDQRKRGLIPDHLLLLEHLHVITLGRNGSMENLLAGEAELRAAGIDFFESDRGGDITYHGPGQVVGYPIMDLREWKRDVGAFVRTVEQVMIDALADFGVQAGRVKGCTGVWVEAEAGPPRKIGAIGVHLSRWVSSHGFALNVNTDMTYFQYIVPCGLAKPVTSMAQLGVRAETGEVGRRLAFHFGRCFDREILITEPALEMAL